LVTVPAASAVGDRPADGFLGEDRRCEFDRIVRLDCLGDVGQRIATRHEAIRVADRRVEAHPEHPEQAGAIEGQRLAAGIVEPASASVRVDHPAQQRAEQRVLHRLDRTDAGLATPIGRSVKLDNHADGLGDDLQVAVQQLVAAGFILQRAHHGRRIDELAGRRIGDCDDRLDPGFKVGRAADTSAQLTAVAPELLDHARNVHQNDPARVLTIGHKCPNWRR